jgi:carbamoyltransferase
MYILGVNISHHPSLALLKDGELIYYLEDDRWNKRKEEPWTLKSYIRSITDILKYTKHLDHIIFVSFCRGDSYTEDFYAEESDKEMIEEVKKQLSQWTITYGEEHYYLEHHLYHACSAFYGSEFNEAAALVLDGGGAYVRDYIRNRESESMFYFSETGKCELISQVFTPSCITCFDPPFKIEDNKILSSTGSCGWLFNSIAAVTRLHSAGKIMGLAPYGNSSELDNDVWFDYDQKTDRWYTNNKNVLNTIRKIYENDDVNPSFDESFLKNPTFEQNSNLAKKLQNETKEHTIRLIQMLLDKVQTNNIVLSGGYFLNCVNNYEYIKAFPDVNFYVDPLSHDGGTAVGGAKYVWHHLLNKKTKYPLKNLFLGG